MLQSCPACSRWRSALTARNHAETASSGTCGSRNRTGIFSFHCSSTWMYSNILSLFFLTSSSVQSVTPTTSIPPILSIFSASSRVTNFISVLKIPWALRARPGWEEIRQARMFQTHTNFPLYLFTRQPDIKPHNHHHHKALLWPSHRISAHLSISIYNRIPSRRHNFLLCPHFSCHYNDVRKTQRLFCAGGWLMPTDWCGIAVPWDVPFIVA